MAELRAQEQRFSRWEEAIDQRFSRWEEKIDQRFSRLEEMIAALGVSRKQNQADQRESFTKPQVIQENDDRSPLDRYSPSSQKVETEVETEPIETKHGTVKREANAEVISAIDKEEPIRQLQVHVSKLEPSLRFHNASPDVCEDFKSLVGFDGLFDHGKARAELVSKSTSVTNNQVAHQLFDKIPLRKRIVPKEHKERFHKSWRFKFKDKVQPSKLIQEQLGVHEGNATRNHANTQASKYVSDVLRTTLGPNSMLKMLLDAGGGIVVTTDGNDILREIDTAHPATKSMSELSRTQDKEVGDGTTSVIVLAGELLHIGESFIEKNYHPTVICQAYKGENQTNAELVREGDWEVLLKLEEEYIENICVQILKFKPDLVITEKGLSDLACHYFSKAGVSTTRRLRKTDNNNIAKACGAVIVKRPDALQESDVIICPLADHLKPEYVVFFTKEASGKLEQFSGLCKELQDIDVSLASFYVWLRQTSFAVRQVRKLRLSPKPWLFKFKQKLIRLKLRDKEFQIAMPLEAAAPIYLTVEYLSQFSSKVDIDKEHSSSSLRANQIWDPGGKISLQLKLHVNSQGSKSTLQRKTEVCPEVCFYVNLEVKVL